MKKIILPGIVAGVAMLIVGMAFNFLMGAVIPSLEAEYANENVFRPWGDPLMNAFFLYPFILGIVLSFLWNKTKKLYKGTNTNRALQFGVLWLVLTIPGMFITLTTLQVSIIAISVWLASAFINGLVAGCVFTKMNK